MVTGSASVILGISAYYHDSAAALLVDGTVLAAAEEERFSRKKHDASFPKGAIAYCLAEAGISLSDVTAVVFYEKPLLKFERILETAILYSPRGLSRFIESMSVWLSGKLFFRTLLERELQAIGPYDKKKTPILFSTHHLSHAASAFYPSPYPDAAILTLDAVGEWATASLARGTGKNIEMLKELHFPHSLGLLYSAGTEYLGFTVNDGEYKVMGLAPYADPNSSRVTALEEKIQTHMLVSREDGSFFLNERYFDYTVGFRTAKHDAWERLLAIPPRRPDEELGEAHTALASALQKILSSHITTMARHLQELTGAKNLCIAGGVALNAMAMSGLRAEKIFDNVWIQPAAGDAGGALGAAYAAYYLHFGGTQGRKSETMHVALGPYYTDSEIEMVLQEVGADYEKADSEAMLMEKTVELLASGNVLGWFQGRMEWGPRALGNRSILADPRRAEVVKYINESVKLRESFRPFAPAVLREDVDMYFDGAGDSPYMLFTAPLATSQRLPSAPGNDFDSLATRLSIPRSTLPAITHVDYSARVQTVTTEDNERLYALLSAWKRRTGTSVLLNTSFNRKDEPMVCTPLDAYRCFTESGLDTLVMGSYILRKN